MQSLVLFPSLIDATSQMLSILGKLRKPVLDIIFMWAEKAEV